MEDSQMMQTLPCCTFFHRHPLLLCFLFSLAFLHAAFYPLFAFLLASSPILLLTAFLLGGVLLHSVPQEHDQHVYKISHSHLVQCHVTSTATSTVGARHNNSSRPGSADSPPTTSDSDTQPVIMCTTTSLASFPDAIGDDSESESETEHHEQKHHHRSEEVVCAVAWTADDTKSIENIGSLELERNAAVEKLMSRRLATRRQSHRRHHYHIAADLDDDASRLTVHVVKSNPFDLDAPYGDDGFPASAPSMLLHPLRSNPFFDDDEDNELLHLHAPQPQQQSLSTGASAQKNAVLFRRNGSFTVGAPYASDFRPSRFRPYFVTEKMQGQPVTVLEASGKMSSSSSSSSSSSAGAKAYASVSTNKEEEEAADQEALAEAEEAAMSEAKTDDHHVVIRPHEVVAVDVELISDSSDDDISLPEHMKVYQQQQQQVAVSDQDDDDERESFEVENIMKQVAAAAAAEGKCKQLDTDPAYQYSPSAGTMENKKKKKQKDEEVLDQLPPVAPPTMAQTNKLASMWRVFSEDEADELWAAPSRPEETTATEKEARKQDMFPLPPLPEYAPAAGASPPLAAAAKKAVGKSSKYTPPSKKAVLGFFRK